jgi:hypothetical protein
MVISLAKPDLPEEVTREGDAHQLLETVGPRELIGVQIPEQGLAPVEEVAGFNVLMP